MSVIHDWGDWLGSYPFKVTKAEEIFDRFQQKNFLLKKMKTCAGSLGRNEFVFERHGDA